MKSSTILVTAIFYLTILTISGLRAQSAGVKLNDTSEEDLALRLRGQAPDPTSRTRGFPPPIETEELRVNVRLNPHRLGPGFAAYVPVPNEQSKGTRGTPKDIRVGGKAVVTANQWPAVRLDEVTPTAEESAGVDPDEKTFEVTVAIDPKSRVTTTSILFSKDSTEFANADSEEQVKFLAKVLKEELAEHSFLILGHSSAEGSCPYNDELSQARAAAVVAHLVDCGVSEDKLFAAGRGEREAHHADSAPEVARAKDRKVEILRLASTTGLPKSTP